MVSRHTWIHRVRALKRQAVGSSAIQAAGSTPLEAAATTAAANTSLYLGVGIGVGGALLLACIVVIVAIARKRAEHKRALAELEQGGHTVGVAQAQHVRSGVDVPRPVTLARVGRLVPAHGKGGWGALGSNEDVNEPDLVNHPARTRRRSRISLPKRIKQNGVQLKRLKHLSAIIESPRSRSAHSPTPEAPDLPVLPMSKGRVTEAPGSGSKLFDRKGTQQPEDVFVGPSSPKPEVLPSFAIRSPGRYGVSFVEDSPNKAKRSHSVGALIGSVPGSDGDVFGQASIDSRPPIHTRSISLGAHRVSSQPPSGPVPPLPVIAPHEKQVSGARDGFCLSRISASSQESSSSSVLVTSPILRGLDEEMNSPSLEQMVSEDDNASLKTVSHRQWQNPLVAAPRPIPDTSPTVPATAMAHQHKPSIRSNIARYSTDSQLSRQLSAASVASSLNSDRNNRLSIPRLGTADRVSIRSVSSVASFTNDSGIRNVTTPRKVSRCSTTVSENGSPAERQKTGVLRDISGNAGTPSRQASSATQTSSRRSSNGNPFQWDSAPLQKPSALKGSPNARKGHKRQNCVRISTLTPQILGPPPSRPTSPSIMHGIEEEPTDFAEHPMAGLPFTRRSRPSSATAFAPHLRISTLRASLTASSPTLSSWTTFQDPGLPSQPSDSMPAVSASPGTTGTRSVSRQSGQSSNYSIPSFPSPSKTTVTAVQRDQPVPEFYFTRPSTDEEPSFDFGWGDRSNNDPPPYDVDPSNDVEIPSSPPLPVAKENEYDPACPMIVIPRRDGSHEYDPASPAFATPAVEPSQSSPSHASTVTFSDDTERYSRPVSYSEEYHLESPPCSPKSMPQDFGTFSLSSAAEEEKEEEEEYSASSTPRATLSSSVEKPTSANASTIMARIRTHSKKVDFPGAPILPPPIDDNPVPFPLNMSTSSSTRNRSASSALNLRPHRPAPQPPLPFPNTTKTSIPSSLLPSPNSHSPWSSPESPSRRSPSGPRCAPAKPIAKQIVALRRMNSEMDTSTSHQSRRYIHGLSREPAPLLPWIGSTEQSDSCNDMFDFDFGSTPSRDANGGAQAESDIDEGERSPRSALDNIDLSEIERRLEGALAGFDVPVSPTVVDDDDDDDDHDDDRVVKPSGRLVLDSCREFKPTSSPSPSPSTFQHEKENEDRSSSVWEDGEKFWDRTSLSTIPGSSPSDAEKARALAAVQTPRVYGSPLRGLGGAMRVSKMRPASGIMATPRSLYDADGFLRT